MERRRAGVVYMGERDDLVLAVEHLVQVHDRDESQHSDGGAGDTGENKDG